MNNNKVKRVVRDCLSILSNPRMDIKDKNHNVFDMLHKLEKELNRK